MREEEEEKKEKASLWSALLGRQGGGCSLSLGSSLSVVAYKEEEEVEEVKTLCANI